MGAQVDPSIAFAEAIAVLRRDGERSIIEEEAKQRIRSVYRFAWNLPHTKEVLAHINLMIWSDVDLAGDSPCRTVGLPSDQRARHGDQFCSG